MERSASNRAVARAFGKSEPVSQGDPLQLAMSMINFYINRAGKKLPSSRRLVLEEAKEELRKVFKKEI